MNPMKPTHEDETDGKFLQQVKEAFEPTTGTPGSTKTVLPAHSPTPEPLPERIGPYEIRRLIASGGMGVVYEALQEHPRRSVALKVMRRGVTSRVALRRFEHESQLLGRLRHTGIAQVYDAGTHHDVSGPLPYFAMEYIPNARPITEYVREKKLSTRRKLELFIQVCDAVHHGHLKGIVHRDLKPGNILVDAAGQVKIIDFGVARSTDSDMIATSLQTGFGELVGTLKYMSPEQCAGDSNDIDVRSDVYALGVVLYEMLSGKLPYDLDNTPMFKAPRVIREAPPVHLSKIDRMLRGDIETIVETALEKERDRRFQSVLAFKEDIERFLRNEPILVRRASAIYRLGRFAKRQRIPLGVAAVLCILAGFSGGSYFHARETEIRRSSAVAATADALAILNSLNEVFVNRLFPQGRENRRAIIGDGIAAFTRLIEHVPDIPLPYAVRGKLYARLEHYSEAEQDAERALQLDPANPVAWRVLGFAHYTKGRWAEARNALDKGIRNPGAIPIHAEDYYLRARLYWRAGMYEAAFADAERAVRLAPDIGRVYQLRGLSRRFLDQVDEAIEDLIRAGDLDADLAHQGYLWIWEMRMLRGDPGDAERANESLAAAFQSLPDDQRREFDSMVLETCEGSSRPDDLIRRARTDSERLVAYYYAAARRLVDQKPEEARAYFRGALEVPGGPRHFEYDLAHWHLGRLSGGGSPRARDDAGGPQRQ